MARKKEQEEGLTRRPRQGKAEGRKADEEEG